LEILHCVTMTSLTCGLLGAEVEGEAGGGGFGVEVATGEGGFALPGPDFADEHRIVPGQECIGGAGDAGNCSDLLFELSFSRIKCNRLKVEAFERLSVENRPRTVQDARCKIDGGRLGAWLLR
jgi:hypothetical protein